MTPDTTLKNTSMTIVAPGVMANDTDANGDTLTAVLDSGLSNGGSLTFNSDGSFTYNPPTGYTGTDTFYYHDNDGHVNGNIATVTLNAIDFLPPSQPSSFYGTINYDAPPQPVGLTVEAYVPGVATPVATTTIQGSSSLTYAFDVPGDINRIRQGRRCGGRYRHIHDL